MSEKQTLSALLRCKEVYQDVSTEEPGPKATAWRNNLLSEFESSPSLPVQKYRSDADRDTPLEVSHLLTLMPVGLALFALGWAFGSQIISLEQIARVSPLVWMSVSVVGSLAFLFWRRQSIGLRR